MHPPTQAPFFERSALDFVTSKIDLFRVVMQCSKERVFGERICTYVYASTPIYIHVRPLRRYSHRCSDQVRGGKDRWDSLSLHVLLYWHGYVLGICWSSFSSALKEP